MDNESILNLPMQDNDAGAKTIREYIVLLALTVWQENVNFSGKRPFGNSGWEYDLYAPLVKAGAVKGTFDEYGCIDIDSFEEEQKADKIITKAIKSLMK